MEDRELNARLPDQMQLAVVLTAAGDFEVEEPEPSQMLPLAPRRSKPAGHRTYFLVSEEGGFPSQLDLTLYRTASSEEAVKLWEEVDLLSAYRYQATNVVDRDPEEVRARQSMWQFSLDSADEVTRAVGMCLSGWQARGLHGCDLSVWSVAFCSWALDVGLALSHTVDLDVAEVLTQVETLVREEVGCL